MSNMHYVDLNDNENKQNSKIQNVFNPQMLKETELHPARVARNADQQTSFKSCQNSMQTKLDFFFLENIKLFVE